MPGNDFWFLAGLGCAFVGFGIMKVLLAHAAVVDGRAKISLLEELKADLAKKS